MDQTGGHSIYQTESKSIGRDAHFILARAPTRTEPVEAASTAAKRSSFNTLSKNLSGSRCSWRFPKSDCNYGFPFQRSKNHRNFNKVDKMPDKRLVKNLCRLYDATGISAINPAKLISLTERIEEALLNGQRFGAQFKRHPFLKSSS